MKDTKYEIVFMGDYPIGVKSVMGTHNVLGDKITVDNFSGLFSPELDSNLYGRIMTLLEAVVDTDKLKAVKDVFSKELRSFRTDVYQSVKETADGGGSSSNIYNRR